MKTGIIYKATGPTGKVYVGKTTSSIDKRKTQHCSNAYNRNHSAYNTKFYRAIRKYGNKCFVWEFIISAPESSLNEKENKFILLYNSYKSGYNSTLGGEGCTGLVHSDQTKKKIGRLSKIRNSGAGNPRFNKTVSKATRKKISVANRGRKQSAEAKRKKSKSLSGRRKTRSSRDAIASSTGRPFLVFRNDKFIGRWVNQRGCAEDLDANRTGIRMCLNKKRKTHKGFVFIYEAEIK